MAEKKAVTPLQQRLEQRAESQARQAVSTLVTQMDAVFSHAEGELKFSVMGQSLTLVKGIGGEVTEVHISPNSIKRVVRDYLSSLILASFTRIETDRFMSLVDQVQEIADNQQQ